MSARNYLSAPDTVTAGVTDDVSGDEAEAAGFVVVEHVHWSDLTLEVTPLKIYQRKEKMEQETLNSMERSLRLLNQSEKAAMATGEEILRQREQLERTDQQLDQVRGTLKQSKKHIRDLKGVFGGVKSYVVKKCRSRTPSPNKRTDASSDSSGLRPAISLLNCSMQKEVTRLGRSTENEGMKIQDLKPITLDTADCTTFPSDVDGIVEKNLNEISSSIQRLKYFALGLNDELDSQNELVEHLIVKADNADSIVVNQTKELAEILGKH